MKKLVSMSAGIDSTTLAYKLVKEFGKENVIGVSFDFKQKYNENKTTDKIEFDDCICGMEKINVIIKDLGIKHIKIDLPFISELLTNFKDEYKNGDPIKDLNSGKSDFAYRNLLFISCLVNIATLYGCDEIYLGFSPVDYLGYWDCRESFVNAINNVLKLKAEAERGFVPPIIVTPWTKYKYKWEYMKEGLEMGIDYGKTTTCYNPKKVDGVWHACGNCPGCVDRLTQFKNLKMEDPMPYWGKKII